MTLQRLDPSSRHQIPEAEDAPPALSRRGQFKYISTSSHISIFSTAPCQTSLKVYDSTNIEQDISSHIPKWYAYFPSLPSDTKPSTNHPASLSIDRNIQPSVTPPRHPPLHLHKHICPLHDARIYR